MNSPIRWYGGKGHLVKELLKHEPPHETSVEPFSGGASLLFAKKPATVEVYNDAYGILVNFFRVLRWQPEPFRKLIELCPYSRWEYERIKNILDFNIQYSLIAETLESGDSGCDVELAVEFFVRCRQCMSGDIRGGWSYGIKKNTVNKWLSAIDKLPEVVQRLREVQVEYLSAIECIEKYDTYGTFFYVDPPYMQSQRSKTKYIVDLSSYGHQLLLEKLLSVQGMVLLSGYHNPFYDKELESWYSRDIEVVSQATPTTRGTKLLGEGALKKNQKRVEVLWWNEQLEKATSQMKFDF